jgi:hypothetical protein
MYPFRTRTALLSLPGAAEGDKSTCKSRKADARTRTGDPFITSFEPLSPAVISGHSRAEAAGLAMTHGDLR